MKQPDTRPCYVCERVPHRGARLTKDHIVPRAWFSPPLPKNLPTAGACVECQARLSQHEERIKNILVSAHGHEPSAFIEAFEKVERSGRRPSCVGHAVIENPSGVLLVAPVVVPGQDDVEEVFGKITRGLFFKTHRRLMGPVAMAVRMLNKESATSYSDTLLRGMGCRVRQLGKEFLWTLAAPPGEPENAIWLYLVFAAGVVCVQTGRLAADLGPVPAASGVAIRLAGLRDPERTLKT